MSPPDPRIAAAVRRAFDNAGLGDLHDGPVPLDRLIGDFALEHEEIPALTRARVAESLARFGIDCDSLPADQTPLAGFICAGPRLGAVFVSRDDPLTRRRFSAAHELGHYLLHFDRDRDDAFAHDDTADTLDPLADPAEGEDWLDLAAMEREANRFAAELLMPADTVRRIVATLAQRRRLTDTFLTNQIAADLLVSRQAARWRLRELSLL